MKTESTIAAFAALLLATGCDSPAKNGDPRLAKAEAVIDAFYSFNPARLRGSLPDAPDSLPESCFTKAGRKAETMSSSIANHAAWRAMPRSAVP